MKSISSFTAFLVVCSVCLLQCSARLTAEYWVKKYSMQVNIEGGMYTETYRSSESCSKLPPRYGINATRTFSTHIYYLLENEEFSLFHQLKTDEIWHHYYGDTMSLYVIDRVTGELTVQHLGKATRNFIAVIKQGDWYAAKLRSPKPGKYCLLGITVAPGFEIEDYSEIERDELIALFPQHKRTITKLTRA